MPGLPTGNGRGNLLLNDTAISRGVKRLLRLTLPLLGALLIVAYERQFSELVRRHPSTVPVMLVAMMGGMLLQQVRHWLIVGLCFGISAMAIRDAFRIALLPQEVQKPVILTLYAVSWVGISLLAAGAGASEALKPGSIWARRCYFAAAALYCGGRGVLWYPSWESLVFIATGIVAAVGIFLAPRTIWAEPEVPAEDEDIKAQRERTATRYAALAKREWKG